MVDAERDVEALLQLHEDYRAKAGEHRHKTTLMRFEDLFPTAAAREGALGWRPQPSEDETGDEKAMLFITALAMMNVEDLYGLECRDIIPMLDRLRVESRFSDVCYGMGKLLFLTHGAVRSLRAMVCVIILLCTNVVILQSPFYVTTVVENRLSGGSGSIAIFSICVASSDRMWHGIYKRYALRCCMRSS